MGVYLPNLEMPENCFECPWRCKVDPENLLCRISGEYFEETFSGTIQNRHKSCPLVPVPPHGRCIDENALLKGCGYIIADGMACIPAKYIANAPTIIPAEEGET